MRLAMFPLHLCKVLCLPRKSDIRSYEVLRLPRKITLANLKIWCSKMQPISGNQRPDLLTSLMNMSFVPLEMHFKILFKGPTPAIVFRNATKPSRFAHFWQGAQSFAPATRKHIWTILNVQKCSEPIIFLHFDFDMCFAASRHNCVHFFDISSSKSGPDLVCFVHFDFETCFAPQRRALFQHRNFQKWSGHGVPCTFWLRNVLRTTTACTFSTSQIPKVVRTWCAFYILTSKCASCHNGVQFFISHLARWLRTRRFSEPTFRPSGATNHSTNTVFRFATFLPFRSFSRTCIFFLLTLSLLWSSLFYSSLWLFPSLLFICPYCRKFDF